MPPDRIIDDDDVNPDDDEPAGPVVTVEDSYWAAVPDALIFDKGISFYAFRLYAALRRYGASPENCFPGRARLAEQLGVSLSTIKRCISELATAGWIAVKERFRADGSQTSNGYHVWNSPRPPLQVPEESAGGPGGAPRQGPRRASNNESQGNQSQVMKAAASKNVDERARQKGVERRNDARRSAAPEVVSPHLADAERLANLLADACAASPPGSKRPTVTRAWVQTMERVLRLDGRAPEQVARCIEWVFTNPAGDFWVPNIRSPQKLRAQYDRLRADAARAARAARGPAASQALVEAADSFYGLREEALAKAVADGLLVQNEAGDYEEPEPEVRTVEERIAELAAAGDERGLQEIFDRWPHLGRQYYGLPEPDYTLGATA